MGIDLRQPSPEADVFRWWRDTLAGKRPPRFEDVPEAGYYKLRMVRGGPWVPVAIWVEQEIDPETGELTAPERLVAIRNGEPVDPARIWTYCRPISVEEYDSLTGVRARHPEMAATMAAVSLGDMPAIRP